MSSKPPFLFRTASDGSRGLNTTDTIDPLYGRDAEYHANLEDIPYCTARMMLHDHINYNYKVPSEFSSWSVSLLYVLVHAVRKAYACDEKEVLIYVMDAKDVEDGRIHSAAKLLKKYDIGGFHYRKTKASLREMVDGEYLVHGKLENDGLWQAVHFDELLVGNVLWRALPGLQNKARTDLLLQRVKQLRKRYFSNFENIWPLVPDEEYLDPMKTVASHFGKEREATMFIALISIGRRDLSGDHVAALYTEIGATSIPQVPFSTNSGLRTVHMEWRGVTEAQQFMQILRLLQDKQDADKKQPSESMELRPAETSEDTEQRAEEELDDDSTGDEL